jgi:hypothetical protein
VFNGSTPEPWVVLTTARSARFWPMSVRVTAKTTELTDAGGRRVTVNDLPARLRPSAWARRACGIGTKGYRVYDWAIINSDDPDHQYLIRRATNLPVTLSASPAPAGQSRNASKQEKDTSGSTTTRSASTTPGTDTSP